MKCRENIKKFRLWSALGEILAFPTGMLVFPPVFPPSPNRHEKQRTEHWEDMDACFIIHPPRHPPPRGTPLPLSDPALEYDAVAGGGV